MYSEGFLLLIPRENMWDVTARYEILCVTAYSANEEAELGLFNSVANSSGVGEFSKEVKF